jgi:cytochrome b subunit of formate dehydrogenase
MDRMKALKKAVHWGLLAMTIVFIVSGFGITEYRLVESASLGLLSKQLSFAVHLALITPFMLLLALHLYLTIAGKRAKKKA